MLLSSYYLLNFSSLKRKSLISGFLLSALILIKYTNLPFAAFVFLHHVIKFYKSNKDKKLLFKETLNFAIPFIALNLLFIFLHPEYLKVAKALNSNELDLSRSFTQLTGYFLKLSWESIIFLLLILSSLYIFLFQKDFFSMFSLISMLTIFSYVLIKHPIITESHFYYRYLIPAFPFLIISLINFLSQDHNLLKKSLLIFPIVFIVFPNINMIYAYHHLTDLDKILSHPITFLPDQGDKRVLSDFNRLQVYGEKINLENYDEIFTETNYDGLAVEYFIKGNLITNETVTKFLEIEWKKLDPYKNHIIKEDYSIISLGPIIGISPVYKLIRRIYLGNDTINRENLPSYYSIAIPSLELLDHPKFTFLLSDYQEYSEFRKKVWDYYNNVYDKICSKSEFLAIWTSSVLTSVDQFPFSKECNSNKDYYKLLMGSLISKKIYLRDFLAVLSIYILILLFIILLQYTLAKKLNFKTVLFLIPVAIFLLISLKTSPQECTPPFYPTADNKSCCTDINDNRFCDQLEKEQVKECIAYLDNDLVPLAKECSSAEDCKSKETLQSFLLNKTNAIECKESAYGYIRPLGRCDTKKDCVKYLQEKLRKTYESIVDCRANACVTLKHVSEKVIIKFNTNPSTLVSYQ